MMLIVVSRILTPAPDVHGLLIKTCEYVKLWRFAGKMTCYQLTLSKKIGLDYLGGSNLITSVLKSATRPQKRTREIAT